MTLLTPRLSMTPFAPRDADELTSVFRDPHVRRWLLDDALVDRAWIDGEIASSAARFDSGSIGLYAIRFRVDGADGAIAGFAGFRPFYDPPVLQLLYGLLPAHTGEGYASEAARALLRFAFEQRGFAVVRASMDAPNDASMWVARRIGMRPTGGTETATLPQLHMAITREEWEELA